MKRNQKIAIHPNRRPSTLPNRDWGIGRNPSTGPEPETRQFLFFCVLSALTPPLHDPDYAKLRIPKLKVLDPVPSYADYIRGKGHGSI